MKQKTLQFALEWCSRTQEFQVGRQPIPSTEYGNRESPVTNLSTRSWYDQVTVTRWTQRRPWRNVRGGRQQAGSVIGSVHVQLSLSLHFYVLYLLLNSCDGNDALWRHSMLMKQSSSFSRKHWILSLQICVRQTVQLTTVWRTQIWRTTEFVDWCRNVCTLYKHVSEILAAVTSNLKQRLTDTWASISQNVIDEAVGQWRKRLCASMKAK